MYGTAGELLHSGHKHLLFETKYTHVEVCSGREGHVRWHSPLYCPTVFQRTLGPVGVYLQLSLGTRRKEKLKAIEPQNPVPFLALFLIYSFDRFSFIYRNSEAVSYRHIVGRVGIAYFYLSKESVFFMKFLCSLFSHSLSMLFSLSWNSLSSLSWPESH